MNLFSTCRSIPLFLSFRMRWYSGWGTVPWLIPSRCRNVDATVPYPGRNPCSRLRSGQSSVGRAAVATQGDPLLSAGQFYELPPERCHPTPELEFGSVDGTQVTANAATNSLVAMTPPVSLTGGFSRRKPPLGTMTATRTRLRTLVRDPAETGIPSQVHPLVRSEKPVTRTLRVRSSATRPAALPPIRTPAWPARADPRRRSSGISFTTRSV